MKLRTLLAATAALLLAYGTASAQTSPAGAGTSTTRSTNNVGFGGTVNGTNPTTGTSAPARYDDPNSSLPSNAPRMKATKDKSMKMKSGKMKHSHDVTPG